MTSPNRAFFSGGRVRPVLALLGAGALFLSSPASADSRNDAKRHFREGMTLISAGQVERGIAELKQAYAIKPHPDVLYDIAKAYIDLGNIHEAVNYFKQYSATDPEDKERVEKVIARLSATLGTAPAAAPPPGQLTMNGQPLDVQKLVAQLQMVVTQLQVQQQQAAAAAAAEKAAAAAAARNGPASSAVKQAVAKTSVVPAPAPATASDETFEPEVISARTKATAAEIARELERSAGAHSDEDMFDEQIVSAGVRSFSENRAPASLTIITADEIRLSGASSVPEILRRVPGIDVAEMNPSDTNISFRGFNRRLSNKVLVLVDGRSVYQDFLGATFFSLLDVSMQDISRIEVIRGPGSALYGANAFAGVINIITKVGDDADGVRGFAEGGSHNTFQGNVSVGGHSGKLAYRTTVAFDRADKWAKDVLVPGMTSQFALPDRSRELQRADLNAVYELGREDAIRFGAGFDNMNSLEVVSLGSLRTFGNNGQAGFARAELDFGQTRLKGFWNALRMNSGPEYWPSNALSISSAVRSDVVDLSAQTGFDFKALGTHHVNFGAGYRYNTVDWGYLSVHRDNTRYEEHHFNAFLQEEWQPRKEVSLILSYRVDRNPLLYSQHLTPGGLMHSPRGSLLWEVAPDQVLRLTVGSAFRAPTFLESYVDLFTPIPGQTGVGIRFQGDRNLRPEQMLQAELGYRGRFGAFQPEIVLYGERVKDLITDGSLRAPGSPAEAVDPVTGQMIAAYTGFQNESSSFLGVGAEIGGRWSPRDGIDIGANYSFEQLLGCQPGGSCTSDQTSASQITAYLGNTAQHKANLFATWRTKINFDFGVDVHYVSAVTWMEKSFQATPGGLGVAFGSDKLPAYTMVNGRVGYNFIKDRLQGGVSFYNLLESDETGHQEHPFGNRIGRRVLFTAAGSF